MLLRLARPLVPAGSGSDAEQEAPLGLGARAAVLLQAFSPAYWQALATVALLYFARFDVTFGMLRAKAVSHARV